VAIEPFDPNGPCVRCEHLFVSSRLFFHFLLRSPIQFIDCTPASSSKTCSVGLLFRFPCFASVQLKHPSFRIVLLSFYSCACLILNMRASWIFDNFNPARIVTLWQFGEVAYESVPLTNVTCRVLDGIECYGKLRDSECLLMVASSYYYSAMTRQWWGIIIVTKIRQRLLYSSGVSVPLVWHHRPVPETDMQPW
jgi:hypothetical protein